MKLPRRSFLRNSAAGLAALPLLKSSRSYAAALDVRAMGPAKFVDVDGIRTRYFDAGSGDPLVMVHGGHFGLGGAGAKGFMPVFGHLAQHFHVYSFDKLGMGFTDNPKTDDGWTMKATVEHAYGFLKKMGMQKASLAGHSRGALPVTRIAIDHPEMVRSLIIFDSNTLAPGDPAPSVQDPAGDEPPPTKESIRQSLMTSRSSYTKNHITGELIEADLEVALLPKIKEAARKMELLRSRFVEKNPEKVKARPGLNGISGSGFWMYEVKDETLELIKAGRLKTPTLIVWGYNDVSAPYTLGVDLLKVISPHVGRTQLHVFNHSGHSPYAEYPEEVTRLLVDFIKHS